MEIINHFSVRNVLKNKEKNEKRKKNVGTENLNKQNKNNPDSVKKGCLSSEVLNSLVQMGYKIEKIIILHKLSHFITVNEAVYLLERDPETNLYNHNFYNEQNIKEQNKSNHIPDSKELVCFICGGKKSEHKKKIINKTESFQVYREREPLCSSPEKNNKNKEIDYNKYLISKETLESFENPNICQICFNNEINKNNVAQLKCLHFFCDQCINTYLTMNITNGNVTHIKCLMGGCPRIYSSKEIKANVSSLIYQKYKKFYNQKKKLTNLNKLYINCPYPDCEEIVDCEESDKGFAKCNNNHIFCVKCKQLGYHKEGKCKDEDFLLLQEIKKQKKSTFKNFKQCPKCKVIIEKNEGCNQMHCVNCNFEFCWLCLKKYTSNHYALYNLKGCPGMRFDEDKGSKWRQNCFLKCLWYIMSFFLCILVLVLIVLFYMICGCAYEFITCYINGVKKDDVDDEEEEEEEDDIERQTKESDLEQVNFNENYFHNSNEHPHKGEITKEKVEKKPKLVCIILLGVLGILSQPIYLLLYLVYLFMQCMRHCNCWLLYSFYS